MLKVSAAEFHRNIGRYQDLALWQPVAVTRNGCDGTVLISKEEYERRPCHQSPVDNCRFCGSRGARVVRLPKLVPARAKLLKHLAALGSDLLKCLGDGALHAL